MLSTLRQSVETAASVRIASEALQALTSEFRRHDAREDEDRKAGLALQAKLEVRLEKLDTTLGTLTTERSAVNVAVRFLMWVAGVVVLAGAVWGVLKGWLK